MRADDLRRPLPDDLLVVARRAEQKDRRGELTIYLGYAAGVGKTYTMLSDALQQRGEGVDVVIGYVETHGRPETDALAARLETIPGVSIEYQGLALREMDIDAIISRRPQAVLVDELAHTNAPGSRHAKRYEDVEELLSAGISVSTTVNIQHIESLNDAVSQITGIRVAETVPDTAFSGADEIRLIDLTPEELQGRLRAGKVYVRDMAEAAIRRFFSTGNLLALRQLALRYMAVATDRQMMEQMHISAIAGPWPATERLVVGISPGPTAEQMVRAAYRLATRFNADWVVFSLEVGDMRRRSDREQAWLNEALETGRRLGGRIVHYRGEDVAEEVLRYARRNNVTLIMLGKPRGLDLLYSPVYRIVRESHGIDIFFYEPKGEGAAVSVRSQIPRLVTRDHLVGLALVAGVAAVSILLREMVSPATLLVVQLLPVAVATLAFRRGIVLFVAIVSIIVFDLLFVRPYYSLAIGDREYFISFVGFVAIFLVIAVLVTRLRHLLPQIRRSTAEVEAVAGLSRDLAEAETRQEVFETLARHMHGFGHGAFAVLVPGTAGLQIGAGDGMFPLTGKERAIAQWAYDNGEAAGRGTDTLSAGQGHYVPVRVHTRVFCVLGFAFDVPERALTPENKEIFLTMALLGALALGRVD